MTEELIDVYHITNQNNIPSIIEHGLKIEYAISGKDASLFNIYSLMIQEQLKEEEQNRPIIHRDKILYAHMYTDKKKEIEKIKKDIEDVAIIKFKINPNDVYVGDDAIIAQAVFAHVDYIKTGKEIYKRKLFEFLYDYWKGILPLKYYIDEKIKFKWPEVLITFDIPPEEISII